MTTPALDDLIHFALDAAWHAGRVTLGYFQTGVAVERKADATPLTIADYHGAAILSLGELVGCSFGAWPNVQRWYDTVKADLSWQRVNTSFLGFAHSLRGTKFVEL